MVVTVLWLINNPIEFYPIPLPSAKRLKVAKGGAPQTLYTKH